VTPEERKQQEELLKALRAKAAKEADRVLERMELGLVQAACLRSIAKIRVLLGANRSGKSHVGGVDTIIRATGILPECLSDGFPITKLCREGRYWVSSLDFPSSRDITQDKINTFLPQSMREKWREDDRIHFLKNTSEIGFKSAESGRKKYQGTSRMGIWMDEEHPQPIYDECYMRTSDCEGYILFTFTPIEGLTWAYKEHYKKAKRYIHTINKHGIKEEVGLMHTLEEIELLKDRELVVRENTNNDADPDIEVFQMSMYDNKFLPNIEIQRAERKHKDDLASYNARVLGRYTKLTGRNVFNADKLLKRQSQLENKFRRGEIINGQFQIRANGRLVIFKDKKAVSDGFYILGIDPAEGLEQGDYSVIQIVDHRTCEQVAVFKAKIAPEMLADVAVDIAKFFNRAWIIPERNNHGVGVTNRIRNHYKYRNLFSYYNLTTDLNTGIPSKVKMYGWHTNLKTKPIMIQDLATFINDGHLILNDHDTIDELLTYVYDKNGHTNALGGCYDDCVMALALIIQCFKRKTPRVSIDVVSKKSNLNKKDNITGY